MKFFKKKFHSAIKHVKTFLILKILLLGLFAKHFRKDVENRLFLGEEFDFG